MKITDIKAGDFVCYSKTQGYSERQCDKAMQVFDAEDLEYGLITCKCEGGCLTKTKEHFVKVEEEDLHKFKNVYRVKFYNKNQ